MYPLYRSWLSRAEPPPPSSLTLGHAMPLAVDPLRNAMRNPLSLPDVVVAVGESHGVAGPSHQFAAHRAVLAGNSGYFKAALGQEGAAVGAPTCVAVSGVTAEAFAPLLGYMYTGYLDIGTDNIYPVLLATHYLHMPSALELCWNFLRAHPPAGTLDGALDAALDNGPARSTLVKPIAGLPWRHVAARGPLQPPASHMVLPTAEHSPFRAPFPSVSESATPTTTDTSTPAYSPAAVSAHAAAALHAKQSSAHKAPANEDREQAPTKSARRSSRLSPTPPTSRSPQPAGPTGRAGTPNATPVTQATTSTAPVSSTASPPSTSTTMTVTTGKVVFDVACCDGPVQFHRVLNASYGCPDGDVLVEQNHEDVAAADENQLHQRMLPGAAQLRRARVGRQAEGSNAPSGAGGGGGAAENTCHYCNQTFKSHYCYQKHARRHLNPLTPKLGVPVALAAGDEQHATTSPAGATPSTRAPARPLDMNVQYYPCKTCGSKFPSYYFVHKHRKLCHSGEEAEVGAKTAAAADD